MQKVGVGMSAAITAPLVGLAAAAVGVSISYESAFAGVTKTVAGTAAEMEALSNGIREMARNMPASVEEIAGVAEAAGALGVSKENILDFTRVMVDLGETTNLSADTAASELARFANITGMLQTDFDRLGSAIVALGNDGASTEAEIVAMGMRIAAAGKTIGMSEAEILGWSSALSSLGVESEAGGTAISRVFIDMANAVATGSDELDDFAKVAGLTNKEFSVLFAEDSSKAALKFIEGLGGIEEAGGNLFQVLEELGFSDVRVRDTLLRLSGANDLVTDSIKTSSRAWAENTALANEANIRYKTTESRIVITKNRLRDLGITLGNVAKKSLSPFLDGFSEFVLGLDKSFEALSQTNPQLITIGLALAGAAAAIGPLLIGIGLLAPGLAAVGTVLAAIGLPMIALAAGVAALAVAWSTNFMGIQDAASAAATAIAPHIENMKGAITGFATSVSEAFSKTKFPTLAELWADFKAGDFEMVATKIKDAAINLTANLNTELNISGKAEQLRQSITDGINATIGGIGNLKFSGVKSSFDTIRKTIQDTLSTAFSGISIGNAGAAFEKIKGTIQTELTGLLSGIDVEGLKAQFNKIQTSIQTSLTTAFNFNTGAVVASAKTGANNLRDSILGGINDAMSDIGNLKFSSIKSSFNTVRQSIQDTLATAFNGINASGAGAAFGKIKTSIQNALTTLTSGINVVNVVAGFNRIRTQIQGALQTAFSGINASSINRGLTFLRATIESALITAFSGINVSGIRQSLATLRATIESSLIGTFGKFSLGTVVSDIKTSMNGLRDSILSNLTTAIEGMNFEKGGKAFAGLVDKLSTSIENLDLSGIDWAGVLKGAFTALLGPVGAAIRGITWVVSSSEFAGLQTAITGAIGTIPWGDLGTAFAGLGTAIAGQLSKIAADMVGDVSKILPKMPELSLPEIDIDWGQLAISTVGLVNSVSQSISNIDWMGVGASVGSALVGAVKTGISGIGAAISALNWANEAIMSVKAQALVLATNIGVEIGTALRGIDVFKALVGLENSVKGAIGGVIGGALKQVGTEIASSVTEMFPDVFPSINSGFASLASALNTAMSNAIVDGRSVARTVFASLGESISIAMSNAVSHARDTVRTAFESLGSSIGTALTSAIDTAKTFVTTAFASLGAAISSAISRMLAPILGALSTLGLGGGGGAGGGIGGGQLPRVIEDEGQGGRKGRPSLRPEAAAMEPMKWSDYVTPLVWATYVPAVEWGGYVSQLAWETFVSSVDWESFVPALDWGSFVSSLDWGSFVERINWGSFISDVSWDSYIPGMDWGNFVDRLDWGRFVPAFAAPAAGGAASSASVSSARLFTGNDVAVAAAGGVTINVNVASMGSDMDIHSTANKLAREFQRRIR